MASEHSSSFVTRTRFVRRDLPQRKRLAPNVICMFSDGRQPIHQVRRRGRLPKMIASIAKARARRDLKRLESLAQERSYLSSDRANAVNLLRDAADELEFDNDFRGVFIVADMESSEWMRSIAGGSLKRHSGRLANMLATVAECLARK